MSEIISAEKKISAIREFDQLVTAYNAGQFPLKISGVHGSLTAFILKEIFKIKINKTLVVAPTDREAAELQIDLSALGVPCSLFPGWGTVPYRDLPLISGVFAERSKVLSGLCITGNASEIIVTSERAFLTPVPPVEYTKKLIFTITKGDKLDTISLSKTLSEYGWTRVQRVQMPGEFVLHGEVMDMLLGTNNEAYRIVLDFDTVESIKRFDPADQSSIEQVDHFSIYPLKEFFWTDDLIDTLNSNLAQMPEFKDGGKKTIECLIQERKIVGEENLFPLAFKKSASIADYLENGDIVFLDRERLENSQEILEKEYLNLFRNALRERCVPAPSHLLLNFNDLASNVKRCISFLSIRNNLSDSININSSPAKSFFGNINFMKEEFTTLLENGWKIVIAAHSEVQAVRLAELLKDLPDIQIIIAQLSQGFSVNAVKFILIQEKEIFGHVQHKPRSLKTARSKAIDTFVELNPGDYIVHLNYGIGLFKGIDRVKALGNERDYIKLEYADNEFVFVPIEQVNLVQRYIGNEGAAPRLDKLGSKSWSERKQRAKKAAEELASHLIDIYSKRAASKGFSFPADTEWQTMFEASFSYEETEDQLQCVEEIKKDMESSLPMDRLVCGDVGYGKTEVALRACFKAIMGGKQVAFLVPTKILAEQHYETFQERFMNFPVRVAMLSRFVDKKTIRTTIAAVEKGEIDILVGTHRIIQRDIVFKNLGLIVIDEEQRFGVKDKEKLKELKRNVDCLALSATPIPRTLHMSLLKIRDMSILATAPNNRRPIETTISEYDDEKVVKAVLREVERGGQVFFLHNRIESLDDVRLRLQRLLPQMVIEIAHGRMDSGDLEDIMHRFIHGGSHILVSTTIIENGIDIPNVNTIIIDRADMYGVSQLYQLRGRVGRSDKTAYAYLFYPKDKAMNELAMKRLQVISDFTDLGSGFKIAMKDMEIRGAGNLLGKEQSGAIYSVGFDLYVRLLDEAVKKLQTENYEAENETLLELEYSGFIPNNYIASAQEKMDVYKKIASIKTKDELENLKIEINDRFGLPPFEIISLFALAETKIICKELSISSLKERKGVVRIEFAKVSKINIDSIIRLVQESCGKIKVDPTSPNVLLLQTGKIELKEKSEYIKEKLSTLL